MATDDISRFLFHPSYHYSGVRVQQSRPRLDSDVNEGEMLDDEDRRAVAVEVIGPHGSADDGFKIVGFNPALYDFLIHAGSYWLGGIRHEIDELPSTPPTFQRLRFQVDWLQSNRKGAEHLLPSVPNGPRHDLVYLVGWEQSVSAVEDPELLELALGGPDTSLRMRPMHRVYVRHGSAEPTTCAAAFKALMDDHTGGIHSFDPAQHELRSAARLTVVPSNPGDGDLCKPTLSRGYTGAENQTIRVHCIAEDRFLWGYDDTAPLYRIDVPTKASDYIKITFLTPPKDHVHFPTVGQVIEILPWGALLANSGLIADHQIAPDIGGGVFARVVTAYDPSKQQIQALAEDPALLDQMIDWLIANTNENRERYFYVRMWNPGDAGSGAIGIPFKLNTPVSMVGTGLDVRFSQPAIPGDYWILAARPSDPEHVVPWDLLTGVAPHGPRRYYCPLALVSWEIEPFTGPSATLHSCRRTFHPLTRLGRCCTVTVGDGSTSFGDYTTINDALRAVPTDVPVKVCVLPGVYKERIVLRSRADLVIEGCGPTTILRTPDDNDTSEGLVTIDACTNITLRDLKLEAAGQFGVMIFQEIAGPVVFSYDITLENLTISTSRDLDLDEPTLDDLWIPLTPAPFSMSAIAAFLVQGLTIRDCKLDLSYPLSAMPTVYVLFSGKVVIQNSVISAGSHVWGGIQIGGQCEDVLIENNTIRGGVGHGITLGNVSLLSDSPPDHVHIFDPNGRLMMVADGFNYSVIGNLPDTALPPDSNDPAPVAIVDGSTDTRILNNSITQMRGSGISVLGFRPLVEDAEDPYEMFRTDEIEIADNQIIGNFTSALADPLPAGFESVVAFGGIILASASDLRVQDNRVEQSGSSGSLLPVCGIYVIHGENIAIEGNRVLDNGYPPYSGDLVAGTRAGIALQLVGRVVAPDLDEIPIDTDKLLPAARVRGNTVTQILGRALQMYGLGPMFVTDNVFVSQGMGFVTSFEVPVTQCVEIHNIGQSPDLVRYGTVPAFSAFFPAPPLVAPEGTVDEALIDGRILFTNNQIRFNPVAQDTPLTIYCGTSLTSYGDIGVHNNQFYTRFPSDEDGEQLYDTIVACWSTRTINNRWEDPAVEIDTDLFQTDTSALTVAAMNITTLNQATRCIEVVIAMGSPTMLGTNPIDINQTYLECDGDTDLAVLFGPPP